MSLTFQVIRDPKQDKSGGTFLVGTINVPFKRLLKVFNLPCFYDPEGYKVTTEWVISIEDEDGKVHCATIYDWKREDLAPWEYDVWHIGGHSSAALRLVQAILNQ